jgi:hypothetical protein
VFFKLSDVLIARVNNEISSEKLQAEIYNPGRETIEGINPHNIFFTMQIEHGIAGTVLFILLVTYILIFLVKTKKFTALLFVLVTLFVSTLSNYAPYYKYYLLMCIILFVSLRNDMMIIGNEGKHA